MRDIRVQVKGNARAARAVRLGRDLAVTQSGGYTEFTLPALDEYELVDLR